MRNLRLRIVPRHRDAHMITRSSEMSTDKARRPIFCQDTDDVLTGKHYHQVVVCRGCGFSDEDVEQFLDFLKEQCRFAYDIRWIGLVITEAGMGGEGGRQDAFLILHQADVIKLAPKLHLRQTFSISWWEDAFHNGGHEIYPSWFVDMYPPRW